MSPVERAVPVWDNRSFVIFKTKVLKKNNKHDFIGWLIITAKELGLHHSYSKLSEISMLCKFMSIPMIYD